MTTTAQPSTRRLNTAKATVEAIATEMDRDENVFVMGEDVGDYGGIFSSITGLFERFGPERVIDTPISETGFIGAAIGAATEGMRPIVELMFVDFFGVCMDQIYNHMAKIDYESGGNVTVPLVLTTTVGGGYSDGAQHSQCLGGIFAHLSGMMIVVPSNPADAAGLMTAAIRDDNPIVFMFHKGVQGLPWMAKNRRSIGLSGEIAARIAEHDPNMLKTPIERVANPDIPIPYARPLEYAALPTPAGIKEAILKQVNR